MVFLERSDQATALGETDLAENVARKKLNPAPASAVSRTRLRSSSVRSGRNITTMTAMKGPHTIPVSSSAGN